MLQQIEKLKEVRRDLGGLERAVKQISQELELIISQRADVRPLKIPVSIEEWMRERLVVADDGTRIAAGVAYNDYEKWAKARGSEPYTLTRWGRAMTKMFSKKPINGLVVYSGFRLR